MDLTLAENIRSFRKQRSLTQEQLAEVLGVTAGAVYKWESGLSVPELNLIVEMADFFDSSVDTLLGYTMKDNGLASSLERLSACCRRRDPEALAEAEKALKKYPNTFRVVHGCAEAFLIFGTDDRGYLRRALELLEKARLLLSQNTDPEISELTIYGEMASAYLLLGEREKGVELLKQHNKNGIFSDSIGLSLILYLDRPEEAEPFLSEALLRSTFTLVNAIAGCASVFCSRSDYSSAQAILRLGMQFLLGLKTEGASDFSDKVYAELLVLLAHTQSRTGKAEDACASLRMAREFARRFDASPNYGVGSFRFAAVPENVGIYDSLSATAAESIETVLCLLGDQELSDRWKETAEHE